VQTDDDWKKESLEYGFDEIVPVFNRDGWYLISNKRVIIEYNGKAWTHKKQEGSIQSFHWELGQVEYEGVNILSKDQSDAIFTLMKVGLATEYQRNLYREDYGRRHRKLESYRWKKWDEAIQNSTFSLAPRSSTGMVDPTSNRAASRYGRGFEASR
jgi:hypothetical protein